MIVGWLTFVSSAVDAGPARLAAEQAAGFEVSRSPKAPLGPGLAGRPDRPDPDARLWGLRKDPREQELAVARASRKPDRYSARSRPGGPR